MRATATVPARFLLLMPLMVALAACPATDSDGNDGGGGDGGGSGDGGLADGGDAGPGPCLSDFECGEGQVCNDTTGDCEPGNTCNPSLGYANCNFPSPGAGCGGSDEEACVCDEDGVCRERRITCEDCNSDTECGDHPLYDRRAQCVAFADGNYCLVVASARGCPQGYEPDTAGEYCVPATGDCASVFACTDDVDCPAARPVCNKVTGTCAKGCVFDLETGASTCASNQVCHQDGKCRLPCDPAADDCNTIDASYICKEDTGGVYRCRVDGCIDNLECEVPADSPYVGFCDLDTNGCVTDRCRPERNEPDGSNPDCKLPNRCDGTGACVPMTCLERGGAALACLPNNFCCGQCRNITGNPNRDSCDPVPCTGSETPAGDPALELCVVAPNPPWCQACGDSAECTHVNPKEDDRDTNVCLSDLCMSTCESNADCPTRWQCNYLFTTCDPAQGGQCGNAGACVDDGSWGATCTSDADCNTDGGEACVTDPDDGQLKCHAEFFVCDCAPDGSADDADCPADTRCVETGFQTYRCIATKVCIPGAGVCGG